jgi:hypothetical protein
MDKLARTRRGQALKLVERTMRLPTGTVVPFSAEEGTGADALWARIHAVATGASAGAGGVMVEGEEGEGVAPEPAETDGEEG